MKRAWIGFLLAIVLTGAANADDRCSVATLQGSYGFALSGTLTGGLPTVTIGVITFDGNGNASDTGTNSRNGVSRVLPPGTGTYSVDSDCIVPTTLGSG
ncbi:MAG TPA: hypothetical protein VEZ11_07155, partial [Thermoanaerobaculia bacterium]|nr:hypothetical protein [Thermoanaerobaculia bacterium]